MKASGVISALVLSLIGRGVAAACLPYFGVESPANIDNGSAIVQYILMFALGVFVAKSGKLSISAVFGRPVRSEHVVTGFWYAALLLMLAFGVNAIIVWSCAQISPDFAYQFWHFHVGVYYISMPPVSYVPLIFAQFICASIVEEFIFRGLLFRAWMRYGAAVSSVMVAIVFTLLHFGRHLWISTFFFSIVLSLLYIKYQSLWINIIVHALNNVAAFIISYYFDFFWTRPLTHLADLQYWIPELIMLIISLPILVRFIFKSWPQRKRIKGTGSPRPT